MTGVNYHDTNYNRYKDFSGRHIQFEKTHKLCHRYVSFSHKTQSILEPIFRYKRVTYT